MQKTVVCVVGPTASGKTRLGVALAHALDGEVVSADSMQIYRRMDIGTAKPTEAEMEGISHHMIDVVCGSICRSGYPVRGGYFPSGETPNHCGRHWLVY